MPENKPERASFYVDGCNLHQGMRQASLHRFYWLDLWRMAQSILKDYQTLVAVKYFTARITGNEGKLERHSTYIDALKALAQVEIIEGYFQNEPYRCYTCQRPRHIPKEKQTDTNIATAMVFDAFLDRWDAAYLVSGDSDLVPPIKAIRVHFPKKRVVIVSPPGRVSRDLDHHAHALLYLNENRLRHSQLPDEVPANPKPLCRPAKWN